MTFSVFVPGEIFTINAERRMHHSQRAALVQPLRFAAQISVRNALNRGEVAKFTTPVRVTFGPHQSSRGPTADVANHLPACKAVLDGCVDAGLLPDDNPDWVVSQTFLPPVRVPKGGTGVRITFEPVD